MSLLEIKNLTVKYTTENGVATAVDSATFSVEEGETVAVIGHSGSGKSTIALSILKLIQFPGAITGGEIYFEGKNLLTFQDEELRQIRGGAIAMIFQDPFISLNPVLTIGDQLSESLMLHQKLGKNQSLRESEKLLSKVQFENPKKWLKAYPHELSGGMRQRVMLAMALAGKPKLLIADEPTTALDATIQFEILKLLKQIQADYGLAILLITHNQKVARFMSHRQIKIEKGTIINA